MKSILIDVINKRITEVEQHNLNDIYKHIDCEMIDVVQFDKKHDIFVDDEGLLKNLKSGFSFPGYQYPVMGNGLICGINQEGDTVDVTISVDEISKLVTFVDYDVPPKVPPIKIYAF